MHEEAEHISTLELRIHRLERANRRVTAFSGAIAVMLALAVLALVLAPSITPSTMLADSRVKVLRADRIEIVNSNGEVRAVLEDALRLSDKSGVVRSAWGLTDAGTPAVLFLDGHGRQRISVGLAADDTPLLDLTGVVGQESMKLHISEKGQSSLAITGRRGDARAWLTMSEDESQFAVLSPSSEGGIELRHDKNGETSIAIRNEVGTCAALGSKDGAGVLVVAQPSEQSAVGLHSNPDSAGLMITHDGKTERAFVGLRSGHPEVTLRDPSGVTRVEIHGGAQEAGIEIMDSNTAKRARLSVQDGGGASLALRDATGRNGVVAFQEHEGVSSISVQRIDDGVAANLSIDQFKLPRVAVSNYKTNSDFVATTYTDGRPQLLMVNGTSKAQAAFDVSEEGPRLLLLDEDGASRLSAMVTKETVSLRVHTKEEKSAIALGVDEDGRGSISLCDHTGRPRAVLGVTELKTEGVGILETRPPSSLVLFGESGNVIYKAP